MDLAPYRRDGPLPKKTLILQINLEVVMFETPFFALLRGKLLTLGMIILALLGSALYCEHALAADDVYMFSYFRDPDGTSGMYFAYSLDGMSYHAVNGDVAVTGPMAGTTMRDVHIIYGQDGKFHLTHTTEAWTVNTKICYGDSTDLLNWTNKKYVDVMASVPGTQQAWAPESTWDAANSRYVVYWSSEVTGSNRKIYYSTTTDYSTFSAPAVLYSPGFPVIDADIRKDTDGNYVMFVKDERNGIVYKAQGNAILAGPGSSYAASGPYIATVGCEGPNAIKINNTWYVYSDFYSQMGLCTSSDGTTWTNRNNEFIFPATGKHGSVFTVPRAVADNLIAHASLPTTDIEFYGNAGSTDYQTAGNWLGGSTPGINQTAIIQNDQTTNLTSSPSTTIAKLQVGQTSSGALNISGTATLNISGDVKIGRLNSTGSLNISGGALNANSNIQVDNGAVHLDGGTISTNTVYGNGPAAFHFNGGTLKAQSATTSFMTGFNTVDVESGGAVIDTNSNNVTISQALTTASANGGLTKNGSGTLTLCSANTYSGATTITQGTLKIGPNPISVAHRWSFNNSLADSVGASNATIVPGGASDVSLTSNPGQVTLTGGSGSSPGYINLGSNLLPKTSTPVTIELWATPKTVQNWSRIFDLGSGADTDNLFMSWTMGTTPGSDRVGWKDNGIETVSDNTNQPYSLGTEYHIVMELNPVNNSTATAVTWYSAPSGNANLGVYHGTFTKNVTIADLLDTADNLGRSFYSADSTANASYNEVRFWNGALSSSMLETLHNAGPNADLNALLLSSSGLLPSTTAVNITASGATLDFNNFSQTVGSLSGVAGSEVKLGSGTLTVGNSISTTFAGAITSTTGGSMIKQGDGTLTLTGANTFTGLISINGGLINAGSLNNLGNGTSLNFNGGGLQFAGVFDPSVRTMSFQSGGATLDTQTFNITLANAIGNNGAGSLTKNGSGLLTLTVSPTYTGETVINAGQLQLNTGSTTLAAISGQGELIVGSATTATQLTATSINVGTLTLGVNSRVTISPIAGGPTAQSQTTAVPEPSVWILLLIAVTAVAFKMR
jgi:autotransporter-associated beta strand protein